MMTLSIIALVSVMLSVVYVLFMPNVANKPIMLSVIMLNVIILSVIMLNAVKLYVIMLNVVMLNVVMLNVVMLNVVMLNFFKKAQFVSPSHLH